jgi:hypothetical protein
MAKAEAIVLAWIEKKAPMGDLIDAIGEALDERERTSGLALRERVEVLEFAVRELKAKSDMHAIALGRKL